MCHTIVTGLLPEVDQGPMRALRALVHASLKVSKVPSRQAQTCGG